MTQPFEVFNEQNQKKHTQGWVQPRILVLYSPYQWLVLLLYCHAGASMSQAKRAASKHTV
eukprot:1145505-Pelagomonas_calceolata.AAC.3